MYPSKTSSYSSNHFIYQCDFAIFLFSMAEGVENAGIICCFISPEYQESKNCKLELKYGETRRKRILPCIVTDQKGWKPSGWLGLITAGRLYINFEDDSEENIRLKAKELIDQIKEQPSTPKPPSEPTYLMELVKYEYMRNARIERIMNPAKSFPIEQSYINLAIVKTKEQDEREKQLHDAQYSNTIMGTFEEIYGSKTTIDVKDIFETCKNQEKQVLVFGRAGIGKSTFCRYVAYQWATGSYWSQYELLALIPLRRLTTNRYPPDKSYSLIDLMIKEVFQYDLSEKDEKLLKKQFDTKRILWILDGYDEIVQNVPPHLECLFEQLLKTPHHILTSRPYLNTLSYNVQTEITGFTDDNIEKYVQQFFDQMKGDLDDVLIKSQKLLSFLESNSSIWGVAHIPVNLELICSLWSNENWSETEQLTMTTLYSRMTEWLCRRYLTSPNKQIPNLSKNQVYQRCQNELVFLESLAFNAIESNTIIIRPSLLERTLDEAKISLQDHPHILNIGVLKSFNKQGIGTQIETEKDHYFVHLSFQEYFAARYLINALKGSSIEKAIEFIKHRKYNQRYALVFIFMSGLLSESDAKLCLNIFWDNILGEPLDIVGIRHIQLVISCLHETSGKLTIPRRTELLAWIAECIKYSFYAEDGIICIYLLQSLQKAQSVLCEHTIINIFVNLLERNDTDTKATVLSIVSGLKISNPSTTLITSITIALDDKNSEVRRNACEALGNIGKKAAMNVAINKLVSALGDESQDVRLEACEALGKIGEKAATNEVINKLLNSALEDEHHNVRWSACKTLEKIGEKAVTNEVINRLVSALGDASEDVRQNACQAIEKMDEKVATNEVINKLVGALGDEKEHIRSSARQALGNMGEKAATNEVINNLVSALENESEYVRKYACYVLGDMGEKAATNEVINKLVSALEDESWYVRRSACYTLRDIGEKATTKEVINKLGTALEDESEHVRVIACEALGKIGEKAATNEVINKLLSSALEDEHHNVRWSAGKTLGKIGEKAVTNEVTNRLVSALGDASEDVRQNACQAIEKMHEKAVTNEVLNKLVSALEDESVVVRRSACETLGNLSEKAATNEVINKLVSALEDKSEDVRRSTCEALGNLGEKAATNEVINKLVSALEEESGVVRRSACEALGNLGEKAVTNEVINKLVGALGDEREHIRSSACYALENIGEKAATNEVLNKLVSALEDKSEVVRMSACEALGNLGEKAATNEVLNKLVSALEDESVVVRRSACEALGNLGEKAATNEVFNKLVSALEDKSEDVRRCACSALENIDEKAATNEVVNKLVSALKDYSWYVRFCAYSTLEKIGEKAMTNEVINRLVNVLEDESEHVRVSACEVLGKIGEKAATNEVINKLLSSALGDESEYVRCDACKTLGKIGQKAATNQVINKLVNLVNSEDGRTTDEAENVVGKFLSSPSVITQLDPKIISDLCLCKRASNCLKNVSVDQLIDIFLTTKSAAWLSTLSQCTLLKGAAVTITEDKVVVYGSKEPVELLIVDLKLRQKLIETFTDQANRLHLSFDMSSEASRNEPKVSCSSSSCCCDIL